MKKIPQEIIVFCISLILALITFVLQGNIGINMSDEGYLWYGAIQTSKGETPFLDFQSYDPGRYYWIALWFKIFGTTNILTLRIATLLFQALGLTCALLAFRRVSKSWSYLVIIGCILMLWVYPRHKMFDISISMIAVYMVILLLERPVLSRYLLSGVFIGLAAFFGSNHGVYALISFTMAATYIFIKIDNKQSIKKMGSLGIGVLIGYSPMFLMFAFIPGYFKSFIDMIIMMLRLGNTNLPLPIPWPWRVDFWHLPAVDVISGLIVGSLFLLLLLFPIGWILSSFVMKKTNLCLAASVFVGIPYIHHAFSRADLAHLAQGIHPLLLGICFWALAHKNSNRMKSLVILGVLLIASSIVVGRFQPLYQKMQAPPNNTYVKHTITNNELWLDAHTSNFIYTVQGIKEERYLGQGENLFIAPHATTMYPILDLKSPLWDIYLLFPETEDKQLEMIKELQEKNVTLAIVGDLALDGREELRFRNTHPIIWRYLIDNYEEISVEGIPSNYSVLRWSSGAANALNGE